MAPNRSVPLPQLQFWPETRQITAKDVTRLPGSMSGDRDWLPNTPSVRTWCVGSAATHWHDRPRAKPPWSCAVERNRNSNAYRGSRARQCRQGSTGVQGLERRRSGLAYARWRGSQCTRQNCRQMRRNGSIDGACLPYEIDGFDVLNRNRDAGILLAQFALRRVVEYKAIPPLRFRCNRAERRAYLENAH
jgi:hypothetical protein